MASRTAASSPIAEITVSSIKGFQAECLPLDKNRPDLPPKPRFGSFLKAESENISIFAVAYNVITGSPDTIHKPSALGLTRDELRLQQPHIFSLLRTEVHAIVVGYGKQDKVFQYLPPHPADVHDFVFPASTEEIRQLTQDFEFLRLLLHVTDIPADELIAATIREAHREFGSDDQFLLAAGRALSEVMRADYDRLLNILRKIKP